MSDLVKWWVNGSEADQILAADRGLAYGDGLFETMRAVEFSIPLKDLHLDRLTQGAERLGLEVSASAVEQSISNALDWIQGKNWSQALIKLILTRAGSAAGYRPDQAASANIHVRASAIEIPNAPAVLGTKLRTKICDYQLSANPALAGVKHLNRLDQVLASRELGNDDDEGLMLDTEGYLAEGISHNIFLVQGSCLSTPVMSNSGVKGVMRDFLVGQVANMPGISIEERHILPTEILEADELLLTNAVRGVRNISEVKGMWRASGTEMGSKLRELLLDKLTSEFHSF